MLSERIFFALEENIEVSKDFITEVIAFCILGGVNPQKIRFKEGKFNEFWMWEQEHRGVVRDAKLENPEKVCYNKSNGNENGRNCF